MSLVDSLLLVISSALFSVRLFTAYLSIQLIINSFNGKTIHEEQQYICILSESTHKAEFHQHTASSDSLEVAFMYTTTNCNCCCKLLPRHSCKQGVTDRYAQWQGWQIHSTPYSNTTLRLSFSNVQLGHFMFSLSTNCILIPYIFLRTL